MNVVFSSYGEAYSRYSPNQHWVDSEKRTSLVLIVSSHLLQLKIDGHYVGTARFHFNVKHLSYMYM